MRRTVPVIVWLRVRAIPPLLVMSVRTDIDPGVENATLKFTCCPPALVPNAARTCLLPGNPLLSSPVSRSRLMGLIRLSCLVFLFRYLLGALPVQQLLVVEKQCVVVHRPPF